MKTVAIYLLWSIPTIILIAFFAAIVEITWNLKIPDYALNVTVILVLVVLHYYKFRRN